MRYLLNQFNLSMRRIYNVFFTYFLQKSLIAESINIDLYRRNCSYVKRNYIEYKKELNMEFDIPRLNTYNETSQDIIDNKGRSEKIWAEFINNKLNEINNGVLIDGLSLKFEGPTLYCEYIIYNLGIADYDREFGFIQTLKIFMERECEKGIMYSDFQSNLLHNQEEVLDVACDDNPYKPFYSHKSYYKLPHGVSPTVTPIIGILHDRPSSRGKLPDEFGSLKGFKRFLRFFVYLVMRYKKNNEAKWEYEMICTFDWFIYSDWRRGNEENNNNYEYNYGLNLHKEKRLLPEFIDKYVCNLDQFQYWMFLENNELKFDIIKYPVFVYSKQEKEIFLGRFKKAMCDRINEEKKRNY